VQTNNGIPPAEPPEDLITTKEARRLMKTSLCTIYRWVLSGKLRGWKRVGRVMVSRSELLALLQPMPVKPKPAPQPRPVALTPTAAQLAWIQRELDRIGI
jgi:excisionase family DNA binding protein